MIVTISGHREGRKGGIGFLLVVLSDCYHIWTICAINRPSSTTASTISRKPIPPFLPSLCPCMVTITQYNEQEADPGHTASVFNHLLREERPLSADHIDVVRFSALCAEERLHMVWRECPKVLPPSPYNL